MPEHPNATLFRLGYEALRAGDLETVRSLFAHDVVWHIPGNNHHAGDHHGIEDVLALLLMAYRETEGTFKLEFQSVQTTDTHAVATARMSGRKGGRLLDEKVIQVAHMEDGKLTETWFFGGHQDEIDAFWG